MERDCQKCPLDASGVSSCKRGEHQCKNLLEFFEDEKGERLRGLYIKYENTLIDFDLVELTLIRTSHAIERGRIRSKEDKCQP